MNKGRRQELTKLKFKKRMKNLNISQEEQDKWGYYCYKDSGTPCSCYMCRDEKYRNTHRKRNKNIIKLELEEI